MPASSRPAAPTARLVSFENVYISGDTGGVPMTGSTPSRPYTRKGKVRQVMAEGLRALHAAGELDVVTARASDYFGPGGFEQSPFGELVIGKAIVGKSAQVVGNPDVLHTHTYIADAGRTLAELGTRGDVGGEVFHEPDAPAQSTPTIIGMIGDQLGTAIKVEVAPRLLVPGPALFNPSV